jgi:hypothetical protein
MSAGPATTPGKPDRLSPETMRQRLATLKAVRDMIPTDPNTIPTLFKTAHSGLLILLSLDDLTKLINRGTP